MSEASISLIGITKRFGDAAAVRDLSLQVRRGEFVCLLGPSGCGKTTTLRIVAGFLQPDAGQVLIDGQDMASYAPNARDIGMVYQSYALFPHMTVFDNVAFGLRMRKVRFDALAERVARTLELVRLTGLEQRRPPELSGGQQQRVALARAIVIEPKVLLLDEPLSNLDAKLRKEMQFELKMLQRQIGLTTVHVTHDQEEALSLSDTMVIMDRGVIEQIGAPREVYARPRSAFVADFIGKSNFLRGRFRSYNTAESSAIVVTDNEGHFSVSNAEQLPQDTPVELVIRPDRVQMRQGGGEKAENALHGSVRFVTFLGSSVSIEVETAGGCHLTVDRPSGGPEEMLKPGDPIEVVLPSEQLRLLRAV